MDHEEPARRQMPRGSAFMLLTAATVAIMSAASAPSPIYPLYRERWHLSLTLLTVVFAMYVVGLLTALLTVGSLSDHVGRRPVLVAAFLLAAASTAIFWMAHGPMTLILARLVQGAASGTASHPAGLVCAATPRPPLASSQTFGGNVLQVSTATMLQPGCGTRNAPLRPSQAVWPRGKIPLGECPSGSSI